MENSDRIMNGDIVSIRGIHHVVEIQGYQGAYRSVGGKYTNCAIGTKGFLRNIQTGESYRASWKSLTVVHRAHPELW